MRPPNLLFLFTDEQRADTMASYGNARIQTPNLNRLCNEAVVFENAYVTQPVCTPSRSSIMTGLYPHTNGCTENNVPLDLSVPTIAEMLPEDYATAYHGKWHLGDEIFAQHGFDEWRSIEDGYRGHYREGRDRDARSTYHHWLRDKGLAPRGDKAFTRGEVAGFPEELSKPAYLAEEAARFLAENRDRPFCLYVNFLEPHMPFTGPRNEQHDPAEVTLPVNFNHPPTEAGPLKARMLKEFYERNGFGGLGLSTEAGWRKLIARYWGLVSQVDAAVGRILDELAAQGLDEDTIVVFTSDHGDMMGSHRLLAKCVMYEEALKVPLVMRLPGRKEPRRIGGRVSQIDLVPTLLDLVGVRVPDGLHGKTLRPLLESDAAASAADVFVEWNGPNNGLGDRLGRVSLPDWMNKFGPREELVAANRDPVRTVVSGRHKLCLSPLGEHELYDLDADPHETTNLARDPERLDLMRRLRQEIIAWQLSTGDEVELPEIP